VGLATTNVQLWLDKLGTNRPLHGSVFTQEILDLTGPPPIPEYKQDGIGHFEAIKSIPIQAEDRWVRAHSELEALRRSGSRQVDLDAAEAKFSFWTDVKEWGEALDRRLSN
jgi:hypothetical protein